MNITGAWIWHKDTQALLNALRDGGHSAFFVGGCVRNALLGVPVADIDIATDARPETVTVIAENAGFRVIPTGFAHGTVTVLGADVSHEVTTFRRDVKTDGRHAEIAFSTSLDEDAARRDFTMNALYADGAGLVIDPLGGLPDILSRHVRFVRSAEARIREDYLRILRFFRFHAIYGDQAAGIDAEGLAACAENASGLDGLSAERVGAEMRKLLAATDPAPTIASMAQAGVLARILPGANPQSLAPLVHLEAGLIPRWQRRLVVLGGEGSAVRLCLSRAETAEIARIRDEIGSNLTPAAVGWRLGVVEAQDVVLCRAAVLATALPDDWHAHIARGARATRPVSAADFMPMITGPALGKTLRQLEQRWLASDLRLTKAELLA